MSLPRAHWLSPMTIQRFPFFFDPTRERLYNVGDGPILPAHSWIVDQPEVGPHMGLGVGEADFGPEATCYGRWRG